MRYPLLPVALAYLLGIAFADLVPIRELYFASAAALVAISALIWKRAGQYVTCLALFFTAAAHLKFETTAFAPHDLRRLLKDEAHEVVVRGTLAETPYQRIHEREELESWKTIAKVKASAIHLKHGQWAPASGTVLVTTRDILPRKFFRGQPVEVEGVIRPPKSAIAPGLFDYRSYLRRVGIYYQLFPESTNSWRLLSSPRALPLSDRFLRWGKRILAHGLPEDENVRLLWAMTLGWKTALTGEVSEPFVRSGTMHVFAVSGLHITLIALILFSVCRTARVPTNYAAVGVIALLWFYTGVTGWQPSGIRSAIMSSVLLIGHAAARPGNVLNSLAAAAVLTLVWDPLQLFQAGFQLSFSVVLSIVLFTRWLKLWRDRALKSDPFLPRELRPKWTPWIRRPLFWVGDGVIVALATWLGSAPLIAYYFNIWNPISVDANVIVVPLSSAALTCNVGTLTIGWVVPLIAELLNNAAWFFMALMVSVSEWAAKLEWGVYYVPKPNIWTFAAYYTLVIALITGSLFRTAGLKWAAPCLVASGLTWGGFKFSESFETVVTALPLEGGSAVHIRTRTKHILVDSGDDENARWITRPFLQSQGANRLDHLVLTHGDVLHAGGAPRINTLFPAENIWISEARTRSIPYKKAVQHFREKRAPIKPLVAGDRIAASQVLHPAPGESFPRADDNAIVLYFTFGGKRVLLLSDLASRGQNALITRNPDLQADIVITGLPLQGEPVADGFLDAVQPELLIVCDAEYPAHERASERLRARLAERGTRVLYTSDAGAVTLAFRKNGYTFHRARND